MWDAIKSILLLFISAYVGATLARSWQHRNWLEQQRVSDIEKRYIELRTLFDEFVRVASRRHIRATRLHSVLANGTRELIEDRLKEYDKCVLEWNETYNHALQVRLVRVLENGTWIREEIDSLINTPFVEVGRQLESGVRAFRAGKTPLISKAVAKEIATKLDSISYNIAVQGREIFIKLQVTNEARLDDRRRLDERIAEGKLSEVSLVDLLKAILRPEMRT